MKLRSMLFVPGDSERKFMKAKSVGADALILDLEDSVLPEKKAAARLFVADILRQRETRDWAFFVRPNPLDSGLILQDLVSIVQPGLDGIFLPKANSAADIVQVGNYLDALESRAGMTPGTVKIAVVATETPTAMFNLASYAPPHPRLVALTWGAEDLATAIGATSNKAEGGGWSLPFQMARAQCLFAASAAMVTPIDTLYANFKDPDGLRQDCDIARRDGFTGRIAIHPDQVDIINQCFTPTAQEIAEARKVLDAFAANPGSGVINMDGKMYDIPHLKAAKNIIAAVS